MFHCFFELLSPGYNRYLALYRERIKIIMLKDLNYLSDHNDKCTWKFGKSFDPKMDPHRLRPRIANQDASKIDLGEEVIKHSTESTELSLYFVQNWYEFLDESWECKRFLASKLALKSLKYGGLEDLQEKLRNSLISESTLKYFENKLSEHEVSVDDVVDLKSIKLSRENNLKCVIGDWSCCPSQVIITDIEKKILDPDYMMGDSWDEIDIDADFRSSSNAIRFREASCKRNVLHRLSRIMLRNL